MRKKIWKTDGSSYQLSQESDHEVRLSPAIYMVRSNIVGELFLQKTGDKFGFPYKVYSKDVPFVDRVAKTYSMTKGNMGILLNGIKGTGKTVTAEMIANKLEMPILVVSYQFENLPSFINAIDQEVVIFIDEYEKVYTDKEKGDILSVMDGVLTTRYRKVFLLTTNNTNINENLLQRPGRIRYHKTYGNLDISVIDEIVEDLLMKKEFKPEVVEFISSLEIITIDIVKAVIQEVNIHNEPPAEFKDILNVKVLDPIVNIIRIDTDDDGRVKEIPVANDARVEPRKFTPKLLMHSNFLIVNNYTNLGKIIKVIAPNQVQTTRVVEEEEETIVKGKKKIQTVKKVKVETYKVEKSIRVHDSYMDF